MSNKLILSRKEFLQGDDGHKVFSVRLPTELVETLQELANKTNRSRNELVSILLNYAIENIELIDCDD